MKCAILSMFKTIFFHACFQYEFTCYDCDNCTKQEELMAYISIIRYKDTTLLNCLEKTLTVEKIKTLPEIFTINIEKECSETFVNNIPEDFESLDIAALCVNNSVDGTLYDLFAIVEHIGSSIDCGHYISFTKIMNDSNKYIWYKNNDANISEISKQDIYKVKPFLLMYRRRIRQK